MNRLSMKSVHSPPNVVVRLVLVNHYSKAKQHSPDSAQHIVYYPEQVVEVECKVVHFICG